MEVESPRSRVNCGVAHREVAGPYGSAEKLGCKTRRAGALFVSGQNI